MMVILTTMVGFAVLVIGRQIFWIFVAGLGFALGIIYGAQYYINQTDWMILLISSIIAILGALLAYTLQRLAAGIAGIATGLYLTNLFIQYTRPQLGRFTEITPIIIGIACGLLIISFFDWSVIILSSLAGAAIIVSGMNFTNKIELIFLMTLALLGMTIQTIFFIQEDGKGR
jgi:hypothetical protein